MHHLKKIALCEFLVYKNSTRVISRTNSILRVKILAYAPWEVRSVERPFGKRAIRFSTVFLFSLILQRRTDEKKIASTCAIRHSNNTICKCTRTHVRITRFGKFVRFGTDLRAPSKAHRAHIRRSPVGFDRNRPDVFPLVIAETPPGTYFTITYYVRETSP